MCWCAGGSAEQALAGGSPEAGLQAVQQLAPFLPALASEIIPQARPVHLGSRASAVPHAHRAVARGLSCAHAGGRSSDRQDICSPAANGVPVIASHGLD